MSTWTDIYQNMVNDCIQSDRMTDWETNFMESIKQRLQKQKPLSAKQTETLDNIWQKITK